MSSASFDSLRRRARLLLRASGGGDYLDMGDAMEILRELAGVDERDDCPMPDCDGHIDDGICNKCDTPRIALTLIGTCTRGPCASVTCTRPR